MNFVELKLRHLPLGGLSNYCRLPYSFHHWVTTVNVYRAKWPTIRASRRPKQRPQKRPQLKWFKFVPLFVKALIFFILWKKTCFIQSLNQSLKKKKIFYVFYEQWPKGRTEATFRWFNISSLSTTCLSEVELNCGFHKAPKVRLAINEEKRNLRRIFFVLTLVSFNLWNGDSFAHGVYSTF